jgi:hypothetical protein
VYGLTFTKGKIENLFYRFFINLRFKIRIVASVRKIIALGQTDAEEAALLWASDNGIEAERSCLRASETSNGFVLNARSLARQLDWLLRHVAESDATLLLTLDLRLGPEQKKALEFLSAKKKPFLHLWSSLPQPGRLALRFLEMHEVKVLNIVGSAGDNGEPVQPFVWSVLELVPIPKKV